MSHPTSHSNRDGSPQEVCQQGSQRRPSPRPELVNHSGDDINNGRPMLLGDTRLGENPVNPTADEASGQAALGPCAHEEEQDQDQPMHFQNRNSGGTQINPGVATSSSNTEATALPRADTARPSPLLELDDEPVSKTHLASCNEIGFSPTTEKLLEECKTNNAKFLSAIRQAKAVFPTGHGWEAAIATKKENSDIRDLMRIYHRFECHNIYLHVVEAGFHTGAHWIREMRSELARKLCRDFPGRFPNHKVANKCLNWVDQGCRYHEWTEMLSKTSDLGYLIALPSNVPHSA